MMIAISCILTAGVLLYILGVRPKDLPPPQPVSPFAHLDERKAAIYENLRDLQFEYRVGKLSDADYQQTKQDLQKELAAVLAEVDRLKLALGVQAQPVVARPKLNPLTCPHCNAMLPPGQPTAGLALDVYNASSQPGAAKVGKHMILFEPSAGQLAVNETYLFNNPGKTAWNDPDSGTLKFFVPEAAGKPTVQA